MDKSQVFKDLEDFVADNFPDNKQLYWSLHYAKNGSISKSSPRSERSFEDCGNDEAIEKLKRAIERMWGAGYKYLLVAFRDSQNDPKPLEYPIRIPTDTTQQANQIAGFQNQNGLNNPMIGFIQAHGEVLKNAQLDLLTVKHTFEKERLTDRIEQLEAENEELRNKIKPENFIEKIAGNPMVQAVLPGLLGKILGVEMPALAGAPAPNAQTTEPQDANAASDVEITEKQYGNLETAFALTSGVFDDADEALLQLAMWVRNNPDMARQFRNQLRGANHG